MRGLLRGMLRPDHRVALALTLLCSCSTMRAGMGLARTIPRGHHQTALGLGATGKASGSGGGFLGVYGSGALRYGVTDSVEVGGRLDLLGGLMETKVQLLRSPSEESGVDLALAPHFSVASVQTSSGSFLCGLSGNCPVMFGVTTVAVPLMAGVNLPGRNQLIFAPRLAYERAGHDTALSQSLVAGASLGFAQFAGPGQWVVYDVSAEYPVASSFSTTFFQDPYFQGAFRLQAQLGLLFGE